MGHEHDKTVKLLAVVEANLDLELQLIALTRILARQAAREAVAARQTDDATSDGGPTDASEN